LSTNSYFAHNFYRKTTGHDSCSEVRICARYIDLTEFNVKFDYIYFMDDDLLDLKALFGIPVTYAFRLWRKVTSKRKWILSSCSELWVSTPYLAKKYAAWLPHLIRPVASGPLLERNWLSSQDCVSNPSFQRPSLDLSSLSPSLTSLVESTSSFTSGVVRICYHGTWSHRDDMKWLAPVIAEVQLRCSNTIFEVIGDRRVARIFRGIPRVIVLPTMSWPDYLKHTQTARQDIGLAPLLDTLFNRGRGPIKFFDYARCGAVGIYSSGPAFESFVADGVDGFVLKNNQQLWVDTLIKLVCSPEIRASMYEAAWQKVLANSTESPEIQAYLADLREHIKSLE
jgi:hypothetical protein